METLLFIVIILVIGYVIYDHVKYPNKFRGNCGYCGRKHGRTRWWLESLGKDFSFELGYVFNSQECYNEWSKVNYVCNSCITPNEYFENTITHKYKRNYYYFCCPSCLKTFRDSNPELFYEGYKRHSIPSDMRKIIWKRDGGKCKKCGSKDDLHYDHIIPVSKGGSTTVENLEVLCSICNLSKSDRIE
jgi:hypothetical protein|tara:strand:- start:153 stop:716 length:564 start_codon:yes stop_codon:yes gene_type:complete